MIGERQNLGTLVGSICYNKTMFTNKVVLITGGSSGIGEATASLFAQNGADIAFSYKKNKEGADSVVEKIKGLGREAVAVQADLNNDNEAKKVVDETMKEFEKIDILINNVGGYIDGDEWDGPADVWVESLKQNLVSTMSVSKYAIKVFQKQKSGIMVNVASSHGLDGEHDAISYSAAKAGIINITQSYAKLLSPFGRANSVSPSAVNAGYWLTAPKEELDEVLANRPNNKLVEPETVAKKIVFLSSDEAKDITGQNFRVTE